MSWIDEDNKRRRPSETKRNERASAWTFVEGNFTLTVVPALASPKRGQFIWTVRETHNGYLMVADGMAASFDAACGACQAKTRELIGKPQ